MLSACTGMCAINQLMLLSVSSGTFSKIYVNSTSGRGGTRTKQLCVEACEYYTIISSILLRLLLYPLPANATKSIFEVDSLIMRTFYSINNKCIDLFATFDAHR